jgi:trehalose 6-phosphate phosphatase
VPETLIPVPARPLLLLDYDGTLAPIVSDPASAYPHAEVPALLAAIGARAPVVIVSGRDLATLAGLLKDENGAPLAVKAVGLHGAEEGVLGGEVTRRALEAHADILGQLKDAVPAVRGILVEEKGGAAFAVHYRLAENEEAAHAALLQWTEAVPEGLEPVWGKKVVELRPRGVSKGVAAARLAAEHPDLTPVFIGDDVTDEDAIHALNSLRPDAVTVRVGPGETGARYRLPDVGAVVDYLRRFVDAAA